MHHGTIELLGDSILKGIQVRPGTRQYTVKNDMGLDALAQRLGFSLRNDSHFGATAERGGRLLDRLLAKGQEWSAVVMDFGGNDCDFVWSEIAADPTGTHLPHLPPEQFFQRYQAMVRTLKEHNILPVLLTLPPLEPQLFFDWWCRELDRSAVLAWLGGSVRRIFTHQEAYSEAVALLAAQENVPLVDVRSEFLRRGDVGRFLCADGTHPNSAGQALIGQALDRFAERVLHRPGGASPLTA